MDRQDVIRVAEVASESTLSTVSVAPSAGSAIPDSDTIPLIVAEYQSLREEILKHRGLCETSFSLIACPLPEILQNMATRRIK